MSSPHNKANEIHDGEENPNDEKYFNISEGSTYIEEEFMVEDTECDDDCCTCENQNREFTCNRCSVCFLKVSKSNDNKQKQEDLSGEITQRETYNTSKDQIGNNDKHCFNTRNSSLLQDIYKDIENCSELRDPSTISDVGSKYESFSSESSSNAMGDNICLSKTKTYKPKEMSQDRKSKLPVKSIKNNYAEDTEEKQEKNKEYGNTKNVTANNEKLKKANTSAGQKHFGKSGGGTANKKLRPVDTLNKKLTLLTAAHAKPSTIDHKTEESSNHEELPLKNQNNSTDKHIKKNVSSKSSLFFNKPISLSNNKNKDINRVAEGQLVVTKSKTEGGDKKLSSKKESVRNVTNNKDILTKTGLRLTTRHVPTKNSSSEPNLTSNKFEKNVKKEFKPREQKLKPMLEVAEKSCNLSITCKAINSSHYEFKGGFENESSEVRVKPKQSKNLKKNHLA